MPLPKLTIQGNLTADPELRFSANGKALCKMRVASSESRKNDRGAWEDGPTCFLDLTTFDAIAEECAERLRKGSPVLVAGRMQQREWATDDGQKRTAYEVLVESIGPSLRARKNQGEQRAQGDVDPWASAGTAGGAAGASRPAQDDDSPPF